MHRLDRVPRETGRAGAGTDTRHRCVGWQPHDTAWATWVALLPMLLLAVSVPAASLDISRSPVIGDVLITWVVVGVVFAPAVVVSLLGVAALKRKFRVGRGLVSLGCAAAVLFVAALAYGIVGDAGAPDQRDPNSWGPVFAPLVASIVLVPYLAIAVLDAYVIVRLWKRPVQHPLHP